MGASICDEEMFEPRHCFSKILLSRLGKRKKKKKTFKRPIKTQRDRVEREVGGGIGMGNTCKSMADSCQRMTKLTTIL